jgi:hypothetical protein
MEMTRVRTKVRGLTAACEKRTPIHSVSTKMFSARKLSGICTSHRYTQDEIQTMGRSGVSDCGH